MPPIIQQQAQEPVAYYPKVDVEMPENPSIPSKKRSKKESDKGIPRKALKNLIQRELEVQANSTFNELITDKSLNIGG